MLSPYALALRLHLLSLPPEAHAGLPKVQQLLGLNPPIFDGAPGVWADLCKADNRHSARVMIHRWIGGSPCHVARYQPPGYVPPPQQHGRAATAQAWHALAGTVPDAELCARFGVAPAAVCRYRKARGIGRFRQPTPEVAPSPATTP